MSRFHKILICFLLLAGIAIAFHKFFLLAILAAAFLIAIGCGVTLPRLKLFGDFICRGNNSQKQIALTFDDGPDSNSTPQLLELLWREKIPAAFFCIGKRVEKNPEIARQIVRAGHLLENHSYTHSVFFNFFSVEHLQTELQQTQAAIEKISGGAPNFFRPPIGLSNPRVFKAAKNLNLKVIGWTIRSFDTISGKPEKIVARIVRQLQPGAIILLHDGKISTEQLLATVQLLLDKLRKLDYEVVRLDELLK